MYYSEDDIKTNKKQFSLTQILYSIHDKNLV